MNGKEFHHVKVPLLKKHDSHMSDLNKHIEIKGL
jgi:hypothetical protein